jgi:hypothetical protein
MGFTPQIFSWLRRKCPAKVAFFAVYSKILYRSFPDLSPVALLGEAGSIFVYKF